MSSQDVAGPIPRSGEHSFIEVGHEILSTAILPLIKVGLLSFTGERMCTDH